MKGSEDVQKTEGQRQKVHAGKLIHMLSHRLKRQNIIPCGDDGLTTMQKHVLKFILLEDCSDQKGGGTSSRDSGKYTRYGKAADKRNFRRRIFDVHVCIVEDV